MNLSDQIMLAKLRKYTRLTSDQWLALEAEVVNAGGILKAKGTAQSELMFCAGMARAEVIKHPGHASQASHGNGAPGSKGGSGESKDMASTAVIYAGGQASDRISEESAATLDLLDANVGFVGEEDSIAVTNVARVLEDVGASAGSMRGDKSGQMRDIVDMENGLDIARQEIRLMDNMPLKSRTSSRINAAAKVVQELRQTHKTEWGSVD